MWESVNTIIAIVGLFCTIFAAVWSLAWWLNGHFNNIRKDVYALGKEILDKLEYHERHDDQRFSQIRDDIWDIRVRNAAADGILSPNKTYREKDANI